MIDPTYFFMFFIGILFSTIAMSMGIGGAVMFSPFFLIFLKMDPVIAITIGLFIESFGFLTGLTGFIRNKLVDFKIVNRILVFIIIGTLIGVFLREVLNETLIVVVLGTTLVFLSLMFLTKEKVFIGKHPEHHDIFERLINNPVEIDLTVRQSSFLGGILVGLSSSGLGEINEYNFLERIKMAPAIAAGTSVFLVSISALISSIPHMFFLSYSDSLNFIKIISILIFTIPGVMLGALLGVKLSRRIKFRSKERISGVLFMFLGIFVLISVFL